MKTSDLSNALKLCKSSLTTLDIVPVLTHFCFIGDMVYAYNDVSAVVVPLETGVVAAIRGDTLLGVLSTLGAELEMTGNEDSTSVNIKSGKVNIDLSALGNDNFLFEPPEEESEIDIVLDDHFLWGLSKCLSTVGLNALKREFTGVTLSLDKKGRLTVYSTDDVRLSRFSSSTVYQTGDDQEWLLPVSACRQIIEVWGAVKDKLADDESLTLCLGTKWLWVAHETVTLYSKMMPESPPDYLGMVKQIAPPKDSWFKMPSGLSESLRRAQILTAKELQPLIRFTTKASTLKVNVDKRTATGSFEEPFKLKAPVPELVLHLDPGKMHEVSEGMDDIAFHDRCVGVQTGTYQCFIAPINNASAEA